MENSLKCYARTSWHVESWPQPPTPGRQPVPLLCTPLVTSLPRRGFTGRCVDTPGVWCVSRAYNHDPLFPPRSPMNGRPSGLRMLALEGWSILRSRRKDQSGPVNVRQAPWAGNLMSNTQSGVGGMGVASFPCF